MNGWQEETDVGHPWPVDPPPFSHGDAAECHAEPPLCGCEDAE